MRNKLGGLLGRYRIVADHSRHTQVPVSSDLKARSLSQVVGVRLEGKPQKSYALTLQSVQLTLELRDNQLALALIDGDRCAEHYWFILTIARYGAQGCDVLGEARTAPADAGTEEAAADTLVEAYAVRYATHVRTDQLADISYLIDKANLGSKESVCSVLDHLRAS